MNIRNMVTGLKKKKIQNMGQRPQKILSSFFKTVCELNNYGPEFSSIFTAYYWIEREKEIKLLFFFDNLQNSISVQDTRVIKIHDMKG